VRSPSRATTISSATAPIKVTAIKDPKELPWKDDVDIAMECTGIFTAKDKASAHLGNGSKRVLVSAPGDELPTRPSSSASTTTR
jgi:glyceraldehyde 3-phosphate dehydrogenase